FALVQQLLRRFDVFAFVISHSRTGTGLRRELVPDVLLGWPQTENDLWNYFGYANRRRRAWSMKAKLLVSRQLSPFYSGNSQAKTGRSGGVAFPRGQPQETPAWPGSR